MSAKTTIYSARPTATPAVDVTRRAANGDERAEWEAAVDRMLRTTAMRLVAKRLAAGADPDPQLEEACNT